MNSKKLYFRTKLDSVQIALNRVQKDYSENNRAIKYKKN